MRIAPRRKIGAGMDWMDGAETCGDHVPNHWVDLFQPYRRMPAGSPQLHCIHHTSHHPLKGTSFCSFPLYRVAIPWAGRNLISVDGIYGSLGGYLCKRGTCRNPNLDHTGSGQVRTRHPLPDSGQAPRRDMGMFEEVNPEWIT